MELVKDFTDWGSEHVALLWWIFAASVALSLLTPLAAAWMLTRLPADYFVSQRRRRLESAKQHPALRVAVVISKNLLGAVLLIAGLIMLVAPGQGILTIVVAMILIDFPGKYRLERWVISRPNIGRSINWLRKRAGRPPFQHPDTSDD